MLNYFYSSQFKRWMSLILLSIFTSFGTVTIASAKDITPPHILQESQSDRAARLIERGKSLYEAGNYSEAIATLQPALFIYQSQSNPIEEIAVLNNLALAHQQLGEYQLAADNLAKSFTLLKNFDPSETKNILLAQALDIRGKQELMQGNANAAWKTWQQAENSYSLAGNNAGVIRAQINQAQALQVLGFYRQGIKALGQIREELTNQPATITQAVLYRSLGNANLATGNLEQAKISLNKSLAIAKKFDSQDNIASAWFSLGNMARSQQETERAIEYYQQAIQSTPNIVTEVNARLNLVNLLIDRDRNYQRQLKQIKSSITKLPPNRDSIYAQINYARTLLKTNVTDNIEGILQTAIVQSNQIGDRTAEAYGLGSLGRLYEIEGQWQQAQDVTQQALIIAQETNARDIAYQGQWQLGRLYKAQQQTQAAIAAYQQAVTILQSLRSDLVAVNPEVRFTFRESIEPIYRDYVSLLLKNDTSPEANLVAARSAIDSLQLAELENFFQATCLNAQPVVIDRLTDKADASAAIIYPIVLDDRFEIILKLPQQPLRHYTTPIEDLERTDRILQRLSQTLTQRNSLETLTLAQQVYSWIIQPAAADLANSNIKTLVFVLDSPLRNLPMSVLHDGEQYLIEKYSVAITPGLQLIQPQAIASQQLKALTAGLTEAKLGFPPLEYVSEELNAIQSQIASSEQLLNRSFTKVALQSQIERVPFPIVHLATHGQFSSQAEDTFILTWNNKINVNQLSNLLQTGDRDRAIELLVLSACETLAGDRRAALGLAGVAVKAGARSTLATLWRVNDEASSSLMKQFYQQLGNQNESVTKAEALRQAQLSLLKSDRFNHPHFWASYVLVGNWL